MRNEIDIIRLEPIDALWGTQDTAVEGEGLVEEIVPCAVDPFHSQNSTWRWLAAGGCGFAKIVVFASTNGVGLGSWAIPQHEVLTRNGRGREDGKTGDEVGEGVSS
jgi:hypothetical protein